MAELLSIRHVGSTVAWWEVVCIEVKIFWFVLNVRAGITCMGHATSEETQFVVQGWIWMYVVLLYRHLDWKGVMKVEITPSCKSNNVSEYHPKFWTILDLMVTQ